MLFRKNINALRALAVAAVVLYHFNVPGFSGGFVGVDVFFVISGFLMTGILCTALQGERFSLWRFYAARARRIIPALAVLGVALTVFGFFFLPLEDYRDLLKGIKHSLLFTSNLAFAESANYFADSSHSNWLLHTWSLSVEWQFYLLYPLVLWLVARLCGPQWVRWAVLGLAAGSLAASILITGHDVTWAFYHLPTRAWEMLAGGLLWLFPLALSPRVARYAEGGGLLAVAIAIALFDSKDPWPGHGALLPVAGAMLVILANRDSWLSSTAVAQWLGRISYSLYLWHWPWVVGLYLGGLLGNPLAVAAAIGMSLLLGALSFRWIESRRGTAGAPPDSPARTLLRQAAGVAAIILIGSGVGAAVKSHPLLRFTLQEPVRPTYLSSFFSQTCTPTRTKAQDCTLGQGPVKVIVYGDSHAQAVAAAVQLNNPGAALQWSYPGCPALGEFQMRDQPLQQACIAYNHEKLARLDTEFPGIPVVLFSRAGLYTDPDRENSHYVSFAGSHSAVADAEGYVREYASTVCRIAARHPLYLVRPIPDMPFNVYKSLWFQQRFRNDVVDVGAPLEGYRGRNRIAFEAIERARQHCNATVIDPTPVLCPAGVCQGSRQGVSLYWDDNHLVDQGNRLIAPLFKRVFSPAQ